MKRAVIFAVLFAVLFKVFLFDLFLTDGDSMLPTIENGKMIVVNKMQYGIRFPGQRKYLAQWASPKQGEVVVFYAPNGELAIKRCFRTEDKNLFYLLGDNSQNSFDSRFYGLVQIENIIGRALGVK
jgi:signal peptidase I